MKGFGNSKETIFWNLEEYTRHGEIKHSHNQIKPKENGNTEIWATVFKISKFWYKYRSLGIGFSKKTIWNFFILQHLNWYIPIGTGCRPIYLNCCSCFQNNLAEPLMTRLQSRSSKVRPGCERTPSNKYTRYTEINDVTNLPWIALGACSTNKPSP